MVKSPDAFRSIGEVARLVGVAPHVLRYWEEQFSQIAPVRRPDGRRYYRPADVALIAGLVATLRDDGMTIRGARRLIAADKGAALRERGAERLALSAPDEASPPSSRTPAPRRKAVRKAPADQRVGVSATPDHPAPVSGDETGSGGQTDDLDNPLTSPAPSGAQAALWLDRLGRVAARLRVRDGALDPVAAAVARRLVAQHQQARAGTVQSRGN